MLTDTFLPFLLMSVLIELTPGPNMAWLALTAASVGRRAALSATAGIASGLAVVGLVSAFGLAELATAFPAFFAMLRYVGAAYLLFLAWQAWRGEREISGADLRKGDVRTWYRHGLALNVLNPKAFLFFIAILPNYVDATQPVMPQTLLLSATYVAVATLVHALLAVLAGKAHGWFQQGDNALWMRRICALLIAAVAIWFLISTAV
ncbi:LysE family translocator [Sphingorhabdus sp.]|jgi:threonine/homoserine/homoserine lactone efflux protein|uniref:LysE family translocator n=1 Tax=Sphingorhabdus sp. TaxID=1902408 RepID=UPI003BB0D057|nr:LysE family translocator [Sphingomonadales bacterium]MBK9431932.1 LysE family translocator [Sphingomonadales bacterium]MBL0022349.1 LysE family translocator [Sphingomonadales bacterium]